MSKFLSLLLLSVCLLFGFGITSNYEAARKDALKQHKVLLVLLVKRNDDTNKILKDIMQDNQTRTLINRYALFVLLYQDTKQSYPIEMLYSTTTPALFFLDGKEELFICKALRGNIETVKIKECLSTFER